MYKIQIRARKLEGYPEPPADVMQWADLINMPELKDINEVAAFVFENGLVIIESLGFQYQVVPVEGE